MNLRRIKSFSDHNIKKAEKLKIYLTRENVLIVKYTYAGGKHIMPFPLNKKERPYNKTLEFAIAYASWLRGNIGKSVAKIHIFDKPAQKRTRGGGRGKAHPYSFPGATYYENGGNPYYQARTEIKGVKLPNGNPHIVTETFKVSEYVERKRFKTHRQMLMHLRKTIERWIGWTFIGKPVIIDGSRVLLRFVPRHHALKMIGKEGWEDVYGGKCKHSKGYSDLERL